MPHTIRLRGPWEYELLAQSTVRFTRRFHGPTGLDAASRVWLVVDDVDCQASVALNDRLLGEIASSHSVESAGTRRCPTRFEITTGLQSHNWLSITVCSPQAGDGGRPASGSGRGEDCGGLIGLVRLEIE